MQGSKSQLESTKNLSELKDKNNKIQSICELYANSYERACRLYFKPLAQAISGRKINACALCIQTIKDYYPESDFVLHPFIPQIRNSIDHVDYYKKPKENLVVF